MSTPDYLALSDAALLAQCESHVYKSSGPGGQHRNKVSSAVRLHHCPTGISAHGDDSRSQHENRALAVQRLRLKIACLVRRPADMAALRIPPVVAECIFTPRGPARSDAPKRLQVGRKDQRYLPVAQFLLDVLGAAAGRLAEAAAALGIGSTNFVGVLQDDRHILQAAQEIRKAHGLGPLK
jgi:hypothetical protein